MGIRDKLRHGKGEGGEGGDAVEANVPEDTRGEGTATLADRVEPGGQGSPGTNQGKAEPVPPTPAHSSPAAPLAPPSLEDMNVSTNDPQRPSAPAASAAPTTGAEPGPQHGPGNAPRDLSGPGTTPDRIRPTPDMASATGLDLGPENPLSDSTGESHRVPGLLGEESPAEQVETSVEDSAAAMVRDTGRPSGSGDVHGVPVPSEQPAAGSSEEHGVVQGARIPRDDKNR